MAGFLIDGERYEFDSFKLGDWTLIYEITGLESDEFAALNDRPGGLPMRAIPGLVAVAVWRKHPDWSRERVRRFVEQIDFETLSEVPDEEPVVRPPAPSSRSRGSSNASTTSQEDFEAAPA